MSKLKILIFILSFLFAIFRILYNKFYLNGNSKLIPLYTPWGEKLNKSEVWKEYPRPQFQRDSYLNLNGYWDYSITDKGDEIPKVFDGKILVPFPVGSLLSEVNRTLKPTEFLWYKRELNLKEYTNESRVILNFGAVDQICEVFINNKTIGKHRGGYWPFLFDITEHAENSTNLTLILKVTDPLDKEDEAFGKQSLNRGRIWYSQYSGIWQTVWIEYVPLTYIKFVNITPIFDSAEVEFTPYIFGDRYLKGKIEIFDGKNFLLSSDFKCCEKVRMKMPQKFKKWEPGNPFLYDVKFYYGKDSVKSYFGMRKFSVENDKNGIKMYFLNSEPVFLSGVLDQGFWADGGMNAPSDEALEEEIENVRKMGFNVLRKHVKIEPLRFYYHCDKKGIIVWQDFVNGGRKEYSLFSTLLLPILGFDSIKDKYLPSVSEKRKKNNFREVADTLQMLYNSVSLGIWSLFNEGWGQHSTARIKDYLISPFDSSRPIDISSGWHDQGQGNIRSIHIYIFGLNLDKHIKRESNNRALFVSEFGGFSARVKGHESSTNTFGYGEGNNIISSFSSLYSEAEIYIKKGLSGVIYTQLTDIEDEKNGIYTYDRKVRKIDIEVIKEINKKLKLNYK